MDPDTEALRPGGAGPSSKRGREALDGLVRLLQLAYSGEMAAAFAYRGHWRSVRDPNERAQIQKIEAEEWHHRNLVGEMLHKIGAQPSAAREARARLVGRTLGALCHVAGWFAPMYGAGAIERRNIIEYEDAAAFAVGSGHTEFLDCLRQMADVEREHERYFRSRLEGHPLTRLLPLWPAPGEPTQKP